MTSVAKVVDQSKCFVLAGENDFALLVMERTELFFFGNNKRHRRLITTDEQTDRQTSIGRSFFQEEDDGNKMRTIGWSSEAGA